MISFLQNKRLNQFMILLLCMFPIVVAAQGIEDPFGPVSYPLGQSNQQN